MAGGYFLPVWLLGVSAGLAIFVRGLWGASGGRHVRTWAGVALLGFGITALVWLSPWFLHP